jgi:hypothetical protein
VPVRRHDIAVARFDVEQVGFVRQGRAVADGFPHDQWTQPVLSGIDCARTDAAAGNATGNQQRIDLDRCQSRGEVRAEERRPVLLRNHNVRRMAWQAMIDARQR